MADKLQRFLSEHAALSRRFFMGMGAAGATAMGLPSLSASDFSESPQMRQAIEQLESYLTLQDEFRDVSRGKPIPHTLSTGKMSEVGLSRDTWTLEVISDPENPARIGKPLTRKNGNSLNFGDLMGLAKTNSVRFAKVMTCLNIGCPLGTGIWEGVPLRDVLWLTQPREDLRRVFYYGYHNDDPCEMFRSSLPVGRVLEDPYDLPPVIVCYKLNGQWLTSQRGGPVRMVVPEAYGFKSIKWLSHIVLSNLFHANDTYASGNNDVDSPLKTFAATLSVPKQIKAQQPIPITGYAQVGISGLSKVQVWMHRNDEELPPGDRHYAQAPWRDAAILQAPDQWGGGLPGNEIPPPTRGFDPRTKKPLEWPMRLAKVHWAALLPGQAAGQYTFRCRTIDQKGIAQPMPRPFRKSGHCAIEQVDVVIEA